MDQCLESNSVRGPRRVLYLALAAFFFVLAVIGALLPILPTTPFLLVTSYFLVRSSPALNQRLLRSRMFGPLIEDWHRHRAVKPRVKIMSIAISVSAVTLTAIYGNLSTRGLVVLLVLALIGMIVVIRLPVIREDSSPRP